MRKVSAVVTTLNEGEHIEDCLESLQNQTVKPGEIIVVDAESTDGTREIVRRFGDVRLVTVGFHDILRSKDRGFREAKHDLVLCVDGDSVICEDFLEKALKEINEYDAVCGKIKPHDANPLTGAISIFQEKQAMYFSGPAYLMKKESYFEWKEREWSESWEEVPLHRFDIVEVPNLIVWTELPSSTQRDVGVLASVYGALTGLVLWEKISE